MRVHLIRKMSTIVIQQSERLPEITEKQFSRFLEKGGRQVLIDNLKQKVTESALTEKQLNIILQKLSYSPVADYTEFRSNIDSDTYTDKALINIVCRLWESGTTMIDICSVYKKAHC